MNMEQARDRRQKLAPLREPTEDIVCDVVALQKFVKAISKPKPKHVAQVLKFERRQS